MTDGPSSRNVSIPLDNLNPLLVAAVNNEGTSASAAALSLSQKHEIINRFWNPSLRLSDIELTKYDAYFDYFNREFRSYRSSRAYDRGYRYSIGNTLFETVELFKDRRATVDNLRQALGSVDLDSMPLPEIALSLGLFVMVDLRLSKSEFLQPSYKPQLLYGVLSNSLRATLPRSTGQQDLLRIPKGLTARNLDHEAKIRIEWTNSLSDHLRFDDGIEPRVFIFHQVSFLGLHLQWDQQVFPPGFVRETLRTIAILFPHLDVKTKKWLAQRRNEGSKFDPAICNIQDSDLNYENINLEYWQDQMAALVKAFASNRKEQQIKWWFDRRWFAAVALVLTVFFGLVQSIEGAIQVKYAVHPAS